MSTLEQAREGVSLDAQRDRLAAYAKAHDVELVAVEADEGASGTIRPDERPGLRAALARVEAGDAGGLLVMKLDRLSRSTRDVLDLGARSQSKGWRLISVSESLDTATASGRLVVTVLAALAEMERDQISERVGEALDHIAREGRARSRWIPFGMRNADGGVEQVKGDRRPLVKHDEEQRHLRAIVRQRGKGLGVHRIAKHLDRYLGPNPRTCEPWKPDNVASILRTHENLVAAGAR